MNITLKLIAANCSLIATIAVVAVIVSTAMSTNHYQNMPFLFKFSVMVFLFGGVQKI